MGRHVICPVDALQPGAVKIVEAEGRSIGVYNVRGRFYAIKNICPHRFAPLCQGIITGLVVGDRPHLQEMTRDGEIVRCPWHGWEFDITNGQSIFNPHRVRVKAYEVAVEPDPALETYPVAVEQEMVVLYI